MSFNIVICCA